MREMTKYVQFWALILASLKVFSRCTKCAISRQNRLNGIKNADDVIYSKIVLLHIVGIRTLS